MCAVRVRRARVASFVISVSTPSSGVIRKFTPKPAATPAKAAAIPASGLRPDALEGRGPQGDQHEVPGVGGDARDDAEEDDDEASASPLDETPTSLRISAPISPAASASPTPIITTRMIATAEKFRKFDDERREEVPDPLAGQQALDRRGLGHDGVVASRDGLGRPTSDGLVEPP